MIRAITHWEPLGEAVQRLRAAGYDDASCHVLILNAVRDGKVPARLCVDGDWADVPGDKARALSIDFAAGTATGWSPPGRMVVLNLSMEGFPAGSTPLTGEAGDLVQLDRVALTAYRRALEAEDGPAVAIRPVVGPSRGKGGREAIYDWERGAAQVGRYAFHRGAPRPLAQLLEHLSAWFEKTHGRVPDRDRLRAFATARLREVMEPMDGDDDA